VLAEDLAEEAPDGGGGAEQPVAVPDAVLVEGVADAALAQGVAEGQSLVAREAGADLLQGGHEGLECLGRQGRRLRKRRAGPGRTAHERESRPTFIVPGTAWPPSSSATSSGASPCS